MSTNEQRPIILIGFMCAGKTTVAAALARQLNCRAVDLDDVIAQRERRSVPAIIREDGEAQFRVMETAALRLLLEQETARVIALGGGCWTLERNRALIRTYGGFTVWIDTPFELCWRRTRNAKVERPLARDRHSAQQLYTQRRPLYELAALHVAADANRSAEKIAGEIVRALRADSNAL